MTLDQKRVLFEKWCSSKNYSYHSFKLADGRISYYDRVTERCWEAFQHALSL